MAELVLDVRRGATAAALLGALVEAGASVEAIERAVGALGTGSVALQVAATSAGTSLQLRAPRGAPDHETWGELRPRIELLAVEARVATTAVAILDALFEARAEVHGITAKEVEVDPFSGPDDLANAVALGAAVTALGLDRIVATAVGHGTGTKRTIEGPVELPGPVVRALLDGCGTIDLGEEVDVVDPIGAAFIATIHCEDADPGPAEGGRGGLPDGSSVVAHLAARTGTSA